MRRHGVWVPAFAGTTRYGSSFSRHTASEACHFVRALKARGRREDRVRAAPAVSCALMHKKMRTRAYRFSGNTPAFPAQWLYGLYRALPGESEPLATIAPERRWPLKDLTPAIRASGPHDFAARAGTTRQPCRQRPPHPAPRFVTIASRPSCWDEIRTIIKVICVGVKDNFCNSEICTNS
jgi:hypothetical protein